MTNELESLKECPFQKEGELHIPVIIDELGEAWVRCSCDVSGPMFSGADRKEKATEFWNTRYKRTCKMQDALNVPDSDPFDEATDLDGRLENLIRHVADICGAEVVDD